MSRGAVLGGLIAAAAFGPYVAAGFRTEQLAVYGAVAFLAPLLLAQVRFTKHAAGVLVAWGAYVLIAVVGAVAPPLNTSGYVAGSTFAGLDNAALPLAVLLLTAMLAGRGDPVRVLRVVAVVLVVGMCVNAFIAYLQLGGHPIPAAWSAGNDSTASKALENGRYGGLVNQPAEAGTLYGLAMLCALYLLRRRPWLLAAALGALLVGGVLTVSKIFLLIALPIVAWRLIRERGAVPRLVAMSALGVGLWTLLATGSSQWVGSDTLRGLLPSGPDNWVAVLGANRYGAESTLRPVAEGVLHGPALFGYGAGGLLAAYDSQWLESLVVAGLVGLACVIVAGLVLAHAWARAPRSPERTLLGCVLLLLLGACLGLPALTANRVSTLEWLLLGTLLIIVEARPEPPEPVGLGDSRPERGRAGVDRGAR